MQALAASLEHAPHEDASPTPRPRPFVGAGTDHGGRTTFRLDTAPGRTRHSNRNRRCASDAGACYPPLRERILIHIMYGIYGHMGIMNMIARCVGAYARLAAYERICRRFEPA